MLKAYLLGFMSFSACNVIYINTVDMESLTGPEAVSRAIKLTLALRPGPKTTVVHFKVNTQGITLTDNKRRSGSSVTSQLPVDKLLTL